MGANEIHCRSMSYNYIKCSCEKYMADLHLKIIQRYTSIVCIFQKLMTSVVGDEAFIAQETTSRYSKLGEKYNGTV
jgi:hypothetical protein